MRASKSLAVAMAGLVALASAPAVAQVADEAVARRDRSHVRLQAEKVPINPNLPVIEDSAAALRRNADEIGVRALALLAVSMKGAGAPEADYRGFIRRFALDAAFTPAETDFLANAAPSERDMIQFSWRFEAACTLLWAIGLIDSLDRPEKECTAASVMPLLDAPDRAAALQGARLRPIAAILDEADLIYRYRWAIVDIQVGGDPVPEWLSADIALERHHALNWLVVNPPEPWDDVSLDT